MPVSVWRDLISSTIRTRVGCGWTAKPSMRLRHTVRRAGCSPSTRRSPHCWRRPPPRRSDDHRGLGEGPRHRRCGPLRGLSAVPVSRQLPKEPDTVAVRRARTRGRSRRRDRRGRLAFRAGAGRAAGQGNGVDRGALPAVAAPGRREGHRRRRIRACRRTRIGSAVLGALGRGRRTGDLLRAVRHRVGPAAGPYDRRRRGHRRRDGRRRQVGPQPSRNSRAIGGHRRAG